MHNTQADRGSNFKIKVENLRGINAEGECIEIAIKISTDVKGFKVVIVVSYIINLEVL